MTALPPEKRIRELDHSLREHPGRIVLDELEALDSSALVLRQNFRELDNHLRAYQADPGNAMLILDMARRRDLDRLYNETHRLLHNFLAATLTLREHTRTLRDRVAPGLVDEYRSEAARQFTADGAAQACQNLRNFSAHWRPIPLAFVGQGLPPTSTTIVMHRGDLLRWRGWTAPSREWLRQSDEDIGLLALVGGYCWKVMAFHTWFCDAVCRSREDDIAHYGEEERDYFILCIETRLDAWLADPAAAEPLGDRGLFLRIFDIADFDRLDQLPAGSEKRAAEASAMLERHFEVPERLKVKLCRAYRDRRFFPGES